MNTKLPLVSIITVVYNGVLYLEDTIKSVINQSYPNIEYIIIDGGSTDGSVSIINKYRDRIAQSTSEQDKGIYDAMNKGLKKASGEWVNFLNGGDRFYNNEILKTIFCHVEHEKLDFIYGDSIIFSKSSERLIRAAPISKKSLKSGLEACHQSMFVRRDVSPLYNLKYKYKAEFNWVLDIFASIPEERSRHVNVPVVYYALGGFSEKGLFKNLMEFVEIILSRFGFVPTIRNTPHYTVILLRYLKYKFLGYER